MSDPSTVSGRQQRYDDLLQQTGAALQDAAPVGWRRIDLIARILDGVHDIGLSVILSDLSYIEVDLPTPVVDTLVALRELMYQPERGAWLSVRCMMNAPDEFQIFYNYEHDPLWEPPIPIIHFEQDLARYPRPPLRVPGWLRDWIEPATIDGESRTSKAAIGRLASLGFEDQGAVTRCITDLLVTRAPADREQIRVMYRAAGNYEELIGHVLGINGQLIEWQAPPEALEYYRKLRAGMYKDGAGMCTAVSTIVEWPAKTSMNYLFTEDPRWRKPPSRTDLLDDLQSFPRTPANVPGWMKTILPDAERVAEAVARFRQARIFDRRDGAGRPVVVRSHVPYGEVQPILNYLNTARLVMGGRGFDPDLFVPDSARDVPAGFHTDGTWIWSASVPHYLAKHGVPPEPDLLAHIRANGFTPPRLGQETRDAAYMAITGEVPGPGQAPVEAPAVLSDRDRDVLLDIERRVSEVGALPEAYRLLGTLEGARCLERVGDEWQVAHYERGKPRGRERFAQLWDAGAYLLGTLALNQSDLRCGGSDRNTAAALNDWPIQPLPGEPPLTLLTHKHIAVLMPGREIVRYGPSAGNLTFAAETQFGAMSLRAEREQDGPHHYGVLRELRVLSGQTVPWHGQPGGGTAYLLAKSVERHMSDGSLADVHDLPAH